MVIFLFGAYFGGHFSYHSNGKSQINTWATGIIKQSDQSLEYSMNVKLLTGHNLEYLSLTGGCTGSSESTLVKMPHYCKSHVEANFFFFFFFQIYDQDKFWT